MSLTELAQTSIRITPQGLRRLKVLAALGGTTLGGAVDALVDAEARTRGLDRIDLTTADDPELADRERRTVARARRRQAV